MGQTRRHVKNPLNLRSKVNVVSESSMYATHHLIVIDPYAKYGKPTSKGKKVMGGTRICTDGRTDTFTGGIKKNNSLLQCYKIYLLFAF